MSHAMFRRISTLIMSIATALSASVAGSNAAEPEGKSAAGKTSEKLDLSLVSDDAVFAIVGRPQRLLESPQADLYPTEVISALGKKEWGFDPLEIEQAIFVMSLPDFAGNGNPHPQLALRFTKPIDTAKAMRSTVPDGTDSTIDGKPARLPTQQFNPSCAALDDRTLLISFVGTPKIPTAPKADTPLRKVMAAADNSPVAAAYLAVESLRPLIAPVLPEMQREIPPYLVQFTQLFDLVDTAELRVRQTTGRELRFELDLNSADEQSADQVVTLIKDGMMVARSLVLGDLERDMKRNPNDKELNEALLHYLNRMADKAEKELAPERKGNQAKLAVSLPIGGAEIAMLSAMGLPATQAARSAARRNVSQNNLKQIALAMLNYESVNKRLPARAKFDKDGKPLLSWRVMVLPFLEEAGLYKEFHLDEPWDSEHNKALIDKMPPVYKHPELEVGQGKTVYLGVVGKGMAFERSEGLRLRDITDGTSKTIAVVEVAPEKAVPWTKPDDWEIDPEHPLEGLANLPGEIFNAMFFDGHIQSISRGIDPETFRAMCTRNGGEPYENP